MTIDDPAIVLLRPWWLLALPVLAVLALVIARYRASGEWARYIAADKLPWLRVNASGSARWFTHIVLGALAIAILAMAGPSWQQLPLTALKNRQAMVIAFDLSPSMLTWDLQPSRLVQARLKLLDLLRTRTDGDTGLVAYAGDAFRISPLTDDARTIATLVPTLQPDIMPTPGSQTEQAIELAIKLFSNAGLKRGDILLITDGVAAPAQRYIQERLTGDYRLSILAVGTQAGSPIPAPDGGFERDAHGQIINAKVHHASLQALALAHGGRYAQLSTDDSDIKHLSGISKRPFLASNPTSANASALSDGFDSHVDGGWWLVLILLPVAALAFRRNALWLLVLICYLPVPQTAQAASWDELWHGLWRNADQQAAHALRRKNPGDAAKAARLFRSHRWSSVAHYRAGDFAQAARRIADIEPANRRADDYYNQGNASALAGQLDTALHAFDQALSVDPNHADAAHNRALVKQAIAQQRNQQDNAARRREKETRQANEDEQSSTPGEQANAAERAHQSQQSGGGTSSNTQSDGQQALDQQSGQASEAQLAESRADDPDNMGDTPADPDARRANDEVNAALAGGEQRDARNDVLNPYSEQWLRNLPSDPGALMRRKLQYQANARAERRTADANEVPIKGSPPREKRF